jgi:hypothetical protein
MAGDHPAIGVFATVVLVIDRSWSAVIPLVFAARSAGVAREQARCGLARPLLELAVERQDRAGGAAATADELACDPHQHLLLVAGETPCEPVEPDGAVERTRRDDECRVELMQVPAQPLLRAPAFVDEVVAVIDQELQLP